MTAAPDLRDLERFIYREAAMLDDKRWDEWIELFTDDGFYWMPLFPEQQDPLVHTSLFYEDRPLMKMRIDRLRHPRAFSQEPPTRTSHLVSNVMLERADDGEFVVRASFQLLEYRREEQRILGGSVLYTLVGADSGFKIRLKRVDLVNSGAMHEPLQLFI